MAQSRLKELTEMATQYQREGRLDQAIAANAELVQLDPGNYSAQHNLGSNYYDFRRFQQALTHLHAAEKLKPNAFLTEKMLGLTYTRLEQFRPAEAHLQKAYKLKQDDEEVINWLIYALNRNGKPKEVLNILSKVPADKMTFGFYSDKLDALVALSRAPETVPMMEAAIKGDPEDVNLYTLLAKAQAANRDYPASIASYKKVLDSKPEDPNAIANYALGLTHVYKFEEAIKLYHQILQITPDDYRIYTNLAAAYRMMQEMDKCMEALDHAYAIAPWSPHVNYAYGINALLNEQYERGWAHAEYVWHLDDSLKFRPPAQIKNWYGENLSRKKLMIYADQGVGDTLLFLRYFPLIQAKYPDCALSFLVEPKMKDTVLAALPEMSIHILDKSEAYQLSYSADYMVATSTLPMIFNTTIDTIPQLPESVPKERTLDYTDKETKLVVGLSWYTKSPDAGYKRSIALKDFAFLADIPGVKIIDLQYGDTAEERRNCGFDILHDESVNAWESMQDHIDQIHACDLVISVDNTAVHAAGSAGKPVWTILPYECYWRCWHLQHESTPWYPTMRLFRQDARRDYTPVLEAIEKDVRALVAGQEDVLTPPAFKAKKHPKSRINPDTLVLNFLQSGQGWATHMSAQSLRGNAAISDRIALEKGDLPIPTLQDFDTPDMLSYWRYKVPALFNDLERAQHIIINGAQDMSALGDHAKKLLYLGYIAKSVFKKKVTFTNMSCYPEGTLQLTDPQTVAFYRKSLLSADTVSVTDVASQHLLQQLEIPCTLRNDCLENDLPAPAKKKQKIVFLAELPPLDWNAEQALGKIIKDIGKEGYVPQLLCGGPYFSRTRFQPVENQIKGIVESDLEVVCAEHAKDWFEILSAASIVITGDYYTALAALKTKQCTLLLGKNAVNMAVLAHDHQDISVYCDLNDAEPTRTLTLAAQKLMRAL